MFGNIVPEWFLDFSPWLKLQLKHFHQIDRRSAVFCKNSESKNCHEGFFKNLSLGDDFNRQAPQPS